SCESERPLRICHICADFRTVRNRQVNGRKCSPHPKVTPSGRPTRKQQVYRESLYRKRDEIRHQRSKSQRHQQCKRGSQAWKRLEISSLSMEEWAPPTVVIG